MEQLKIINSVNFSTGSEIQTFFNDSTVFITGATGFLGKLLLEKLLWSFKDIRKIYILLRSKKEKALKKRFMEIFETPIFERLKLNRNNYIEKVFYMIGDCTLPNFGLSEEDFDILTQEVHCVFHCAATVRFDNKLKYAANVNMRSTKDLLLIAKEMKQLRAFVHVSTAFSHCPRTEINEEFYPVSLSGNKILKISELLDDSLLDKITPILVGDWPNTYSYTKALAEDIIREEGKGLPIAIVRPSIASAQEPLAGWIDNTYGPTGILLGIFLGVIHTLLCKIDKVADVVPADYVINMIITAAWDVGLTRSNNNNKNCMESQNGIDKQTTFEKDVPNIYNYVSSPQKPISWNTIFKLSIKNYLKFPSTLMVWHYFLFETQYYHLYKFYVYILHYLPAYIMDLILTVMGKKSKFVKSCRSIDKLSASMLYFNSQEWKFSNTNTQALWKRLKTVDRELFNFDMNNINWKTYFYSYMRGCRIHILKDPLDTVPQAKAKQRNIRIAHYTIMTIVILILFFFVRFITLKCI